MTIAYIGLGSNVGDRRKNLLAALRLLDQYGVKVDAVSSAYDTDPVGPPQPNFLNAACKVETTLSSRQLVKVLKELEEEAGRTKSERWGPREIDLDLLLYGSETIDEPDLKVPHPEMTIRAFVMVPLLEIEPLIELPSGEPLSAYCEQTPAGVRFDGPLTD